MKDDLAQHFYTSALQETCNSVRRRDFIPAECDQLSWYENRSAGEPHFASSESAMEIPSNKAQQRLPDSVYFLKRIHFWVCLEPTEYLTNCKPVFFFADAMYLSINSLRYFKKNRCKTYAVYAFFETEYVPVNAELWSSVISHSVIVHSGLAVHLFWCWNNLFFNETGVQWITADQWSVQATLSG